MHARPWAHRCVAAAADPAEWAAKPLHLHSRLQGLVRHRDQALADKTANLNKVSAELSTTKGVLQEERAKLQRREEVS